jgi:hypothetical protein
MAPGDRAARLRFSLNDEEDVEAVASTSSAFAGLTIVPVPSVSSATGGWDIVGTGARGTPFAAASRASRSRGGVSVSSALTDVPSLSSCSPFAGGGWVGGGIWCWWWWWKWWFWWTCWGDLVALDRSTRYW